MYQQFKYISNSSNADMSNRRAVPTHVSLIAGITAGAVEGTATYPSEYLKTRLQLASSNKSLFSILHSTIKSHGIFGLYKGVAPQITGTAFKAGVRFMSFEFLKKSVLTREMFGSSSTVLAGLGCGAIEAVMAVTPSEAIKYPAFL